MTAANAPSSLNALTNGGNARLLVETIKHYELDPAPIFNAAGITLPDESTDQVSSIALQKVWRAAVDQTGDDAFGLKFASLVHPAAFDGLGFAWLASSTLRDALERLVRYHRLIASHADIVLVDKKDEAHLWYQIPEGGHPVPATLDGALGVFVRLCQMTKSEDFAPKRVEFRHSTPNNLDAFEAFFGCPIKFDQPENIICFDAKVLLEPLPMANPELARMSDAVVQDYLKKHAENEWVQKIRHSIIAALPSGVPAQETIAQSLNISLRSMQRRLKEHDSSFKALLDEVRYDLAARYLKEGRSIGEVTYLLGYSEPSNFTRSFKRWSGQTPADYQKSAE